MAGFTVCLEPRANKWHLSIWMLLRKEAASTAKCRSDRSNRLPFTSQAVRWRRYDLLQNRHEGVATKHSCAAQPCATPAYIWAATSPAGIAAKGPAQSCTGARSSRSHKPSLQSRTWPHRLRAIRHRPSRPLHRFRRQRPHSRYRLALAPKVRAARCGSSAMTSAALRP